MLFAWIDEIQKSNGLVGDIFEIGVHHGKSAVFLAVMLDHTREKLAVCGLFEDQTKNISGSGSGDRHIFEQNLKLYLPGGLDTRSFSKSSNELTVEEAGNNYRFIHIDGGHDQSEALSDLQFASRSTIEEGVIAVDDPMTPVWPGVGEAIFYFLSNDKRFCSIVAGFNKMLLVRRDFAALYTRQMDIEELRIEYRIAYPWHFKKLTFMSYPLRIFHLPSWVARRSVRTKLIQYYQQYNWLKHPLLGPAVSFTKLIIQRKRRSGRSE